MQKPVRLDALVGSSVSGSPERSCPGAALSLLVSSSESPVLCAAAPNWEQFPRNATALLISGASSQPTRWGAADSGRRQAEDPQGPPLSVSEHVLPGLPCSPPWSEVLGDAQSLGSLPALGARSRLVGAVATQATSPGGQSGQV